MKTKLLFTLYLTFLCNFVIIFAATHWVVTENGRIQPQVDSVYQLSKSHDLMALLAQEDRMALSEDLRKELFFRKVDYEAKDERDSGLTIEEKLQNTDPDCIKAGKKSTSMTIQESTMPFFSSYGIDVDDYLKENMKMRDEPHCSDYQDLEYSMHCFEHFIALRDRESLVMEPEITLRAHIPSSYSVPDFGSSIAASLKKNSTSWVLYNLATLYWRVQGNAIEAIECARRAVYFSPRIYKTIALVQIGNILSQSQHQEEAILVLHAAVDHTPTDPIAQYTLANSYAIIGDLNRSVLCYENVLRLKPDMEVARKKKHGIQCLHKLEKALENQHSALQSTLNELKDQQKKFEDWNSLQEKIMAAQASVDQRLRSQLEYQEHQLRNSRAPPSMDDCQQFEKDGYMFYQCNIKTDISTLDNWGSTMLDLKNRLINFQAQTHKIVDLLTSRVNQSNTSTISKQDSLDAEINAELELPTKTPKYSRELQPVVVVSEPDLRRCHSVKTPKLEEIPSVFLPPENEGFDVQLLLSEKIGLGRTDNHPLPWYPPICEKLSTKLMPYDQVSSVRNRNHLKLRLPDPDVQRYLLSYLGSNAAAGEEHDSINTIQFTTALAQVGQRILTASKNKAGPVWLLYVLSGLYWRAHGNAQNGVECFRHALKLVPQQWVHLPLVNLAALLLKVGQSQDAASLARMALDSFDTEPNTNFLLGVAELLHGNYPTAATHFKKVLAVDPHYAQANEYLLTATCLSAQSATLQCKKDVGSTVYRTVLRCSSDQPEEEESEEHCEVSLPHSYLSDRSSSTQPSRHGSLEVAAIADTEDNWIIQTDPNLVKKFFEEPLPEGLLRVGKVPSPAPVTLDECQNQRPRPKTQFTSTWLSVAAKNIDFRSLLVSPVPPGDDQPYCDASLGVSMATMDHLSGVRHKEELMYRAESGLKDALHGLVFDNKEKSDVAEAGRYIAHALNKNSTSWVLATAASLYWRVRDDANQAVICLRVALHYAPYSHKDIPLISLANILHRAGLHNDALVAAHMALDISPTFVVIHFTIANIHAARGDVARALAFYQSTLALQPSFEPAREKMIELQCKQLIFDDV